MRHPLRQSAGRFGAVLFACLLPAFVTATAQQERPETMPWQTSDAGHHRIDSVQFIAPAQVNIQARRTSVIELHFHVAEGLHINSHAPHDKTLIPTQIAVAESTGLNTRAIDFPPGTDTTLPFSPNQKMSVYTGEFVLTAHITSAPGNHLWQGVMRYQACDINQCMPPRKLPIAIDVIAK